MSRVCPRIALLTANEAQTQALEKLLQEHITLIHVRTLQEFVKSLEASQFDAFFCEGMIGNGTWKDALETVREQDPDLPLILLSRNSGENEWLEVIQAGAFDLLVPPYDESCVLSLIEHAAASRLARQWHPAELRAAAVGS